MEQLLVWIALAAGGVGLAVPLFRGRTAGGASPPARSLVGGVLAVIGAAGLLSLLTQPPFSPGQTLAPGLALGAITVLVAALALSGSSSPVLVWSGRFGVVTCGVALLTALLSARVLDALVGFAVGAVVTALLLRVEAGQTADRTAAAETTAVLGVTLAAATYLATFHRSPTGVREWQALPVLFSGASSLLLAVRGSLPVPAGREGWYSVLVPLAPLGVIAWLVSQQLHGSAGFLRVVLVGFGVFALLAWIERTSGRAAEDGGAAGAGEGLAGPSLLTALLVLGGAVLAFRELHGYGLALMVLAGFVVFAALSPAPPAPGGGSLSLTGLLLGLLLALYRMYEERNEYARGFRPEFLYYFVALVAGGLLPTLLAELTARRWVPAPEGAAVDAAEPRPTFALGRLLSIIGASVVAPLGVWLLLGDRPQSALLVGVAVGAAGLWGAGRGSATLPISRLSATLVLLSAIQLTHLLAPLALRTRGQRLAILAGVVCVVLLPLLAAVLRERTAPRRQPASGA